MNFRNILTFLIVIITAISVSANKKILIGDINGLNPEDRKQSYDVLLALSGGGARGLTTIGILKAFEADLFSYHCAIGLLCDLLRV